MRILLSDDNTASRDTLADAFKKYGVKQLIQTSSLQDAIEHLEKEGAANVDLLICNYRGAGSTLIDLMLNLSKQVPCIMLIEGKKTDTPIVRDAVVEWVNRAEMSPEKLLARLEDDGFLSKKSGADADFIRIHVSNLSPGKPVPADVYLRLAKGRYCMRFHERDAQDTAELIAYFSSRNLEYFYLRKDQLDHFLSGQSKTLDALLDDPSCSDDAARRIAEEKLAVVHDIVSHLGFDMRVQELTKKVAALTIKTLGSSPSLIDILARVRAHDGKFIASHSLMLAEVACAVAYRIGWHAPPTFLKLSLAALIHDLGLTNNRLARMSRLEEVTESAGFATNDLTMFRLHPIRAAEYASQFHEIPSDVDTIVVQHHEVPDGTGFPRALHHHQISPLATMFIVAHDLLNHYLDHASRGEADGDNLQRFLVENESKYANGTFRKIAEALKTGTPYTL